MKIQQRDANSHYEPLPLDMVIEILTKLPAKFLFRFRCVSRQWCSIIRSRSFVNSFVSHSLSRPRFLLCNIVYRGSERRLIFISLPLYPQDSNHSSVVSKYNFSFNNNFGFCNSVRGIICVSLGLDSFVICNPTTNQFVSIPNDLTGFDPKHNRCDMCLGYDTSNDQYKIMRTMWWVTQVRSPEHSVCTLRLGDQSSFSSWRHVEGGNDYCSRNTNINVLCIDGVVYCGAWDSTYSSVIVMSFDVGSERLLFMEAPKDNNLVRLINYQGKLGCFCVPKDKGFRLWILDNAKKQIWSKAGVIPSSFCDSYWNLKLRICGATSVGEIIFVSKKIDGDFELLYYDLKKNNVSKSFRIRDIGEVGELRHPRSVVVHKATSGDHVENIMSL